MSLFRTKSVEQSIAETEEPEHQLKKDLGVLDLIVFGVGVIIGAGIFVITGHRRRHRTAGPAITISFAIAGLACALAALCYAEFASTVPVAGSAYTFSYATFGELIAWIIGWDLALEFTIGSAALATSFSGYFQEVMEGTFLEVPDVARLGRRRRDRPAGRHHLAAGDGRADPRHQAVQRDQPDRRRHQAAGRRRRHRVRHRATIDAANYSPFIPPSEPTPEGSGGFMDATLISSLLGIDPAVYGIAGVIAGASIVFFAFIGFDIVATTAEETRNPQRDIPRGILGSLAIVTVLYIVVSLVVTGMQNYTDIDPDDAAPLATAFDSVGMDWMGRLISIGACIGLIVVVMILMLGQTRVGLRDGARRAAAARTGEGAPEVRHAVRLHRDHRRGRRDHRRPGRPRDPGPPGQHRHPVRVRARERRRRRSCAAAGPTCRARSGRPRSTSWRRRRCCCAST